MRIIYIERISISGISQMHVKSLAVYVQRYDASRTNPEGHLPGF